MTETTVDTPAAPHAPLDLVARYPACFDLAQPRPLKLGIHRDLWAAGHPRVKVWRALNAYCVRRSYRLALVAGAPRVDRHGQPAGTVTAAEAAEAMAGLTLPGARGRVPSPAPSRPADAPLTPENIVTGRLELTVKFSHLPTPLPVKAGMKIGIQTDTALVVATLPPKVWRKLEQAQAAWPAWIAALTGRLGTAQAADGGPVVLLEQPVLQIFEKKAKSAAEVYDATRIAGR